MTDTHHTSVSRLLECQLPSSRLVSTVSDETMHAPILTSALRLSGDPVQVVRYLSATASIDVHLVSIYACRVIHTHRRRGNTLRFVPIFAVYKLKLEV